MQKNVEKMSINYSPNFNLRKRSVSKVKYLIFHYTGMRSEKKTIDKLLDYNSKVSCHYLINNNGDILSEIVPIIIPKRLIGNILAAKIIVTKYGSPSSCSAYKLSAKNSIALAMPVIPPAPQRTLKSRFLKHSLII